MILGIMQPYFFPHLGYFDLINCSDQWVVFDTVKYIRHGWVNRNRIHHPHDGWQYIVVPLRKHHSYAAICDVEVNDQHDWKLKILGQLEHYKKTAPHFKETKKLIERCLGVQEDMLSRLNVGILEVICEYLDIKFSYQYFSQMNLELGEINGPGDWALNIASAMGASTYVNPPGGRELLDQTHFCEHGVNLEIRDLPPIEYKSANYEYIPRLSIIDLLMWISPNEIKMYLDKFKTRPGTHHG